MAGEPTTARVTELAKAYRAKYRTLDYSQVLPYFWADQESGIACTVRPMRKFPGLGGASPLAPVGYPQLLRWAKAALSAGFRSVICLLPESQLKHYGNVLKREGGLLHWYRQLGLEVLHLPLADPAHMDPGYTGAPFKQLLQRCQAEAVAIFPEMPKPTLLHCSSGIDRASPVAAYLVAALEGSESNWPQLYEG